MTEELFDTWTDKYDAWFDTPSGRYIKHYESEILMDMLNPNPGERILDVGCGTGIFTRPVLDRGSRVTGVDLSLPMLQIAVHRGTADAFAGTCSNMCALPFADNQFDKVFSMTAIEFVEDAKKAVSELNRVTEKGGTVVVTTLNSLSPWADRRTRKAKQGHNLFENIFFRSPEDMRAIVPGAPEIKTAIHFLKDTPEKEIPGIEAAGKKNRPDTGAFLAVKWIKT